MVKYFPPLLVWVGNPLIACQVAVVELVAVSTCPEAGADDALTLTSVVADFNEYAIAFVQLDKSPLVGVPKIGVTNVGLVDNTLLPVPVLVVTPVPPLVTANVALSPAAVPVVFWLNVGHVNVPVLKLPLVGVPNNGVTNVGLVDNTTLPVPVLVVTPVPPLATANVALSPAAVPDVFWFHVGTVPVNPAYGNPVQLVNVPLDGVPNAPPDITYVLLSNDATPFVSLIKPVVAIDNAEIVVKFACFAW